MSEQKIERAKTLMARGEYAKARAIVAAIDHPSKKRWLAQIDQRMARERGRAQRQRLVGLGAVLVIVVLIAVVVIVLNQVSKSAEVIAVPTLRVLQPDVANAFTPIPSLTATSGDTSVSGVNTQAPLETAITQAIVDTATVVPTQGATIGETVVSVVANTQVPPTTSATVTLTPTDTPPYNQTVEVPLAEPASPDQLLRLTRFSFEKTPSGIQSVSLEVQNVSTSNQSGVTWYLLAEPGNTEPWINPAYRSEEQAIQNLEPNHSVTLTFEGVPADFATGTYSLSAWVHSVDPVTGARTHQDGMGYLQPVSIAPPFVLEMGDVQVSSANGQSTVSVTLSARNNTDSPVSIALSYTISASNGDETYKEVLQPIMLASGEAYSRPYTITLTLQPGSYMLTAWLYRYDGETPKPVAGIPDQTPIVIQ